LADAMPANVALGNGSGGPIDDEDYVGVATPRGWPDVFDGVTVSDLRRVQARRVSYVESRNAR
jgi:hypothetical protein